MAMLNMKKEGVVPSLLHNACVATAIYATRISVQSFTELPMSLLSSLLSFFSAADLQRLQPIFSQIGIDTRHEWQKRFRERWVHRFHQPCSLFEEMEHRCYRQLYLQKHFHELLWALDYNDVANANLVYITPRHGNNHNTEQQTSKMTTFSAQQFQSEMLKLAPFVTSLSIFGSQCAVVLSCRTLLQSLCKTTVRLEMHHLQDTHTSQVKKLITELLQFGRLKEVVFHGVKLSKKTLTSILRICAGGSSSSGSGGSDRSLNASASASPFKEQRGRIECIMKDAILEEEEPSDSEDVMSDDNDDDDDIGADSFVQLEDDYDKSLILGAVGHTSESTKNVYEAIGLADKISAVPRVSNLSRLNNTFAASALNNGPENNEHEIPLDVNEDLFNEALQPLNFVNQQVVRNRAIYSRRLLPAHSLRNVHSMQLFKSATCLGVLDVDSDSMMEIFGDSIEEKEQRKRIGQDYCADCHPASSAGDMSPQPHTSSIFSLGLVSMFEVNADIGHQLSDIMMEWPHLQRLALVRTSGKWSLGELFQRTLLSKLSCHQLTHLVLDEVDVSGTFFSALVEVLNRDYKDTGVSSRPALDQLKISSQDLSMHSNEVIASGLHAVKHLHLSSCTVDLSATSTLANLIRYDSALITLSLDGCRFLQTQMAEVLAAVAENTNLQVLDFSGNMIMSHGWKSIVMMVTTNQHLTKLCLNSCEVNGLWLLEESFTQALCQHRNLRELQVRENKLGHHIVPFIKNLFRNEPYSSIKILDISYNIIKAHDLISIATLLHTYNIQNRTIHLQHLDISSNHFYQQQNIIVDAFSRVVHHVTARSIDFMNPFAEHASQQ